MNVPGHVATYAAILRKHIKLLAASMTLVLLAGAIYVWRQQPVYEASATLTIKSPRRNLMGGREALDYFAIDGTGLNTELLLLRQDTNLAQRAVDRLRDEQEVDVAAGGYTRASLPARVQVKPIVGTHAVEFSLTGIDPVSLPKAVNTYAQVYKEHSEGQSSEPFQAQLRELERSEDEAEEALAKAELKRNEFESGNAHVNFVVGSNPADDVRASLVSESVRWAAQREAAVEERRAILREMGRLAVRVEEVEGDVSLSTEGEPGALEERLADDAVVASLHAVDGNAEILRLASKERDAEEADRRLELEGLRAKNEERQALRAKVADYRRRRGRAIARKIEARLAELASEVARIDANEERLRGAEAEAARTNRLLSTYRELSEDVERKKRKLQQVSERKRSFVNSFLPGADDQRRTGPSRLVTIAVPASYANQIAPNVPLILGLTFFSAIGLGLGLVFLIEYFDDTLKSREDFDRYVGLPFLGFVPHIGDKESENPDLASQTKAGTAVAEAFRAIRTSILFSRSDVPAQAILITSAGPGEGKTTVAVNLAATFAKNKGPVLVMDADLRRPRVAKALRLPNDRGLTNVLIGEASLEDVVQPTSIDGLYALTSGPVPPNPAELLHGERLDALLTEAARRYDRMVIDSPPVIAVTDARVLARHAGGLYMVISMGKTSWRLIQRAVESITSIGFDVHGAILNNLSAPTGRYGYYYYRDYTYGHTYYVDDTSAA
jgi:capsular exopolysaccharide synthesis family protein